MTTIEEREKVRLELQERLDAVKTREERNRLGQFATPPKLASDIVGYAISLLSARSKIRFIEPGFGTGPFYSALLHQMLSSRIQTAIGYEIDPNYAESARRLWEDTGLHLYVNDFTRAKPPKTEARKFNLVVCNPPYVRHHHLSQEQKRELQLAVARYLNFEMNGLSGFYTYFMILSQAWMAKDGVGAWLIPSEFMDVNYGRKVKEFLVEKVTLYRIHRFNPDEVQFGDALVSSTVVFFKNSLPSSEHKVEFTFGGTLAMPKKSSLIGLVDLHHIAKWTGLPQGFSRLMKKHNGVTLTDLFSIKRGLATGSNAFFILTKDQVAQFNLPEKFLKPILPSPRDLGTDEIFADNNGEPQIQNRRYLLSCDLPEHEVRRKYPPLWQYLQRGIEHGINKRYLSSHREPWYSQEERPPAPFLCTYMGRPTRKSESPFRFILNHSKATAANVYLLLYPKSDLAASLNNDSELYQKIWKALSSITAETLMGEGRVYGGGLHKLEPKELGNVPADPLLEIASEKQRLWTPSQMQLFAG